MHNILFKCRNHPLFAAIIVISADPLISKWLKQSRARFSDGNRIGARGLAGGYWREWQFENNYKHFQNYILSRMMESGIPQTKHLDLDKRTAECGVRT